MCLCADLAGDEAKPGVQRQASPGPVSLEIFGAEEQDDAPLELPLHAANTVLPAASLQNTGL